MRSSGTVAPVIVAIVGRMSIAVTISDGDIVRIKGFPQFEETDDREARGRQSAIARIASDNTLRRDLELVLAFAVQGKVLEKDKSYRIKRDVERLSTAGGGRRRGFRGFRSDVIFKFEGARKNSAKFSLSTAPRERPEGGDDRPRFERKETSTGEAIVSLRNGTLSKLSLDTKSDVSGENQGREFSFKQETKVSIQRQRANKKNAGDGEKKKKKKKNDKKTEDL